MAIQEIQEKAIDAIVIMSTAVTNLRLYPPTNAMIDQTIDRLLQALATILEEHDPLIIAESEKLLLVAGEPAGPRHQERPQVRAIMEIFTNLGIRSLSFERGLEKEGLTAFLQALDLKPEEIRMEGGLQELLRRKEILHIRVDEKIYIAKDKDQQIVAGIDVKDDDIVTFLMEMDPEAADREHVKEKAKDSEWITTIFQTGMKHLKEKWGSEAGIQMSEHLVQLVRMLEKIADPGDQERIIRLVSRSITELESDGISLFLSQDVGGIFGGRLLEEVIGDLDDARFAEVADGLADMRMAGGEKGRTAGASFDVLINSDKGRKLQSERQAAAAIEKEKMERRLALLKKRAEGFLQEEKVAFLDPHRIAELPGISRELHLLGDDRTADALHEPLIAMLHSRNPEARSRAAEILSQILNDCLADGQSERAAHLTEPLSGWLRSETAFSTAYEKVCRQLKELTRALLEGDPFVEAHPILDILSLIQSGRSPKEPAMALLSAEALRELATEELLETLFRELQTNEQGKQKEAAHTLGRLGVAPVGRLLDMLRESDSSEERVRILQVISEIGVPSIPVITARIIMSEPWYVLRNLVYILGRVGGEAQAIHLAPLLLHENPKVQSEAMKSLQRIGGKVRAETLLSVLPKADAAFKMAIVEMLGTIKAVGAVSALAALLRSKSAAAMKSDLDEKICVALGNIGSEEALPALKEIAGSKGFFAVLTSKEKEKVRIAAEKAITAIARWKP
jgi:HEAT repeat protein